MPPIFALRLRSLCDSERDPWLRFDNALYRRRLTWLGSAAPPLCYMCGFVSCFVVTLQL